MNEPGLHNVIEAISKKRWKVGLIIEGRPGSFDRMWREGPVADVGLIDLADELFEFILESPSSVLGAFREEDFHEWLAVRIQKQLEKKAVICSQLDALLATLKKPTAVEFFKQFAGRDYLRPVLLVTAQRDLVKHANFGVEQCLTMDKREGS